MKILYTWIIIVIVKQYLVQRSNEWTYRVFIINTRRHSISAPRVRAGDYRDTSRIRDTPPVGPYDSPMPRDLWWS